MQLRANMQPRANMPLRADTATRSVAGRALYCAAMLAITLLLTALKPLSTQHAASAAAVDASVEDVAAIPTSAAAEAQASTSAVFSHFSDRILKIQIIDTTSNAKGAIGTGFFVSADGLMLTNYHVVSDRIQEPKEHRVEVVLPDGSGRPVHVLAVDVVHDLAILSTGLRPHRYFTLGPVRLLQGQRLYSLGHPSDLGLTIVEGTYNGNLQHTLFPKIHFTGSINPGMSGGPAITADGHVVGVNVSTMGEQRSFLVPEQQATALLARVRAKGFAPANAPLKEVTEQLREYQQRYLGELLEGPARHVNFGPFRVLTEPAPVFRCWGGGTASDDRGNSPMYKQIWHRCGTEDDIYVSEDQSVGVVALEHVALTSSRLNAVQFAALYSSQFSEDNTPDGSEENVTLWKCSTRNLATTRTTLRAVLCMRALRKMPGLYDAVLKVALLGRSNAGLISTLTLSGASFENIDRLSGRYLEQLAWR